MPKQGYFREKLIREVRKDIKITRRALLRKFNPSTQAQADIQIGQLISDGVFISTGIGRRGYPETIELSPIFSVSRCPLCLRETTL